MTFFVSANSPLLCPLCRRCNLEYSWDTYSKSWSFFCENCKSKAALTEYDIQCAERDTNFGDLLRERLACALGRANKLESQTVYEGPELKVVGGNATLARKRKNPPEVGPIEIPPYEEPEPDPNWDRRNRLNPHVRQRTRLRQVLQRAQRVIDEEDEE